MPVFNMNILEVDFGEVDDPDYMALKYTQAVQDEGKESRSESKSESESEGEDDLEYSRFVKTQ